VPITPRQLEAIIRLAEAGARMRLSEAVTADDAERAVRIVEYWMGKVAGEEGRFDIDIIQTGISQSQREQIISIRDIINELAGPDGVADYEDIVRIAQERGIPPANVDSDDGFIANLKLATIGNFVGRETVEAAIRAGFVSDGGILWIDGVPHAQFVLM